MGPQLGGRRRCTPRWPAGGTCRASAAPREAGRRAAGRAAGSPTASATDASCVAARERSREQVERYLAGVDPDDEPVGVERTVSLTGPPRASLWGRVDRLDDRRGEGVVVVDYKTGRSVLTVDDARTSLALAVYAAGAARTLHRPCTRVELHHLPTGDVLAWDHTEESLGRAPARGPTRWPPSSPGSTSGSRPGCRRDEADEAFPARVGAAVRLVRLPVGVRARPVRCPQRQPWAGVVESGLSRAYRRPSPWNRACSAGRRVAGDGR